MQGLTRAMVQGKVREIEAKIRGEQAKAAWRAEYGPIIEQTALEAAAWTAAELADAMRTNAVLRTTLTDALAASHPDVAAISPDLADTALTVVSSWVAEVSFTAGDEQN